MEDRDVCQGIAGEVIGSFAVLQFCSFAVEKKEIAQRAYGIVEF